MKQRITPEQLAELSEEKKDNLFRWWIDKYQPGDHFIVGPNKYFVGQEYPPTHYLMPTHFPKPIAYPLLSIGQMFEFLSYRYGNRTLSVLDSMGIDIIRYTPRELCDALWETVKEII